MDDDLTSTRTDDTLTHRVERASDVRVSPPRSRPVLPWVLVVLLALLAAGALWYAFAPEEEGDPLATSLLSFEKQNKLTVFSAQLAPVVASRDERFLGLVKSRQVAVIPARVDYTLDLSSIEPDDLDWNAETETLSVELPAITVGRPNLDEGRAQYLREGVWISREAQDNLNRINTRTAEREAVKQARNPVLMKLATGAARDAVRQNLAIPLQVAGFGNVSVEVRFAGEKAPPALPAN